MNRTVINKDAFKDEAPAPGGEENMGQGEYGSTLVYWYWYLTASMQKKNTSKKNKKEPVLSTHIKDILTFVDAPEMP